MTAGFRNVRELVDAEIDGAAKFSTWRKQPTQTTASGFWFDLSMSPGNPSPQYYAASPGVSVAMAQSTDGGIFHGGAVSPANKYLRRMMAMTVTATAVPMPMILLDYLLYYPFIDLDDTDAQVMDNDVTLPRYTTGAGVRPMLVAVAPTTGGGSFTFDYVNQDGVAKTAPTQSCSTGVANIASIITSERATAAGGRVFLALADGDTGVRSITSWTNLVSNGGLGSLVLAKPLGEAAIREINTPAEMSWVRMRAGAPVIEDGAYLNFIMNCAATVAAGTLAGRASFAWSE